MQTETSSPEQGDLAAPDLEAELVASEEAAFCLRLAEARIYRSHIRSLRNSWLIFAALSWLLTLGALLLVLFPYLQVKLAFTVPSEISYVSAFVVIIAAGFSLVSSYRVVIATTMAARATFFIERALAVAETFGVQCKAGASDGR